LLISIEKNAAGALDIPMYPARKHCRLAHARRAAITTKLKALLHESNSAEPSARRPHLLAGLIRCIVRREILNGHGPVETRCSVTEDARRVEDAKVLVVVGGLQNGVAALNQTRNRPLSHDPA
jgi:hypothetical protein